MPCLSDIVFLDFEASSLGKQGYPIEVAWAFASGEEETHLIKPAASWTDWDIRAARIHRIARDQLNAEGEPLEDVVQRMMSVLTGHKLYATAPSWDGKWLSKLLRAAGQPRHALRLEDTEMAHRRIMREVLRDAEVPEELQRALMQDILAQAQRNNDELGPAAHRALADAQRERKLWFDIYRRAQERVSESKVTSAKTGTGLS
ncbi:3'-5' exonuclease [Microvirga lotononidis]|uniref:Exonuclease n=1 Tax=Microvirga lotononidis TaxID=864069 RepID=I4YUU6_9HYPH|nr:transcriptional regulator [Microvirga lotononidis]EIM27738.1 Exonuclease [Microvirga lotononidis]WQO28125.1 transcriptional regulator [Microvirga lotononidis]